MIGTREKLLKTALMLIWQRDYNVVSINEICDSASVTKGAFYHHFASKVDLFVNLAQFYLDSIKQDLDAIFSPQNSAVQQLENLIYFLIESKFTHDQRQCPFFNTGVQLGSSDDQILKALNNLYDHCIIYNSALIDNLTKQDYLENTNNLNTQDLARLMHHYIHGVVDHANFHQNFDEAKKDLTEGLYRILNLKHEYWYQTPPNFDIKFTING